MYIYGVLQKEEKQFKKYELRYIINEMPNKHVIFESISICLEGSLYRLEFL